MAVQKRRHLSTIGRYKNHGNIFLVIAADLADLIFVFFDPIGQALCKRTLNLVEKINDKHADRMRFYLSKADEAGHESDRQVCSTISTSEHWPFKD